MLGVSSLEMVDCLIFEPRLRMRDGTTLLHKLIYSIYLYISLYIYICIFVNTWFNNPVPTVQTLPGVAILTGIELMIFFVHSALFHVLDAGCFYHSGIDPLVEKNFLGGMPEALDEEEVRMAEDGRRKCLTTSNGGNQESLEIEPCKLSTMCPKDPWMALQLMLRKFWMTSSSENVDFPSLSKPALFNHSFFLGKSLTLKYLKVDWVSRRMKFDLWWVGSSSLWSNSSARRFDVSVDLDDLGKNQKIYRVVVVCNDSMAKLCKLLILQLSDIRRILIYQNWIYVGIFSRNT